MPVVLNTYTVVPKEVDRNVALLEAFFAELERVRPAGLHYSVYQREDGASFVHFVESEAGAGPFAGLPAYQAFRSTVEGRCEQPPVMSFLRRVGLYEQLRP